MKNIGALFNEFMKRRDYVRIPFEHRPIRHFKNVSLRKWQIAKPNGYYIGVEADSVILVYDDELIEYKFSELDMLHRQISELDSLGVARLDFSDGITKAIFYIVFLVVFLQFLLWVSS